MNRLVLPKGCSSRGADMGRKRILPPDPTKPVKVQLQKVPMDNGGYDRWGAYWGAPKDVYCAWVWHSYPMEAHNVTTMDFDVCIFTRADSHAEAKEKIRAYLPNVTFYR